MLHLIVILFALFIRTYCNPVAGVGFSACTSENVINVGAGKRVWCNFQVGIDRPYSHETPPHYKLPPNKGRVLELGNYQIFCGRKNAQMAEIIRSAQTVLQEAMKDLDTGSPGHGFEQLFRSTPPSDIKSTFQKIYKGSPMPLSWGSHYNLNPLVPLEMKHSIKNRKFSGIVHPTSPSRGAQSSPRILCADDLNVIEYNLPESLRQACRGGGAARDGEERIAMYWQGTPYIMICPGFWDTTVLPPSIQQVPKSKVCPAWDVKKRQIDNRGASEDDCFFRQAFLFIHEGVHFYVQNSLSSETLPKEVYSWPAIFARQASDLRRNPENYQWYAAMVHSDCQFDETAVFDPAPKTGPDELKEEKKKMKDGKMKKSKKKPPPEWQ